MNCSNCKKKLGCGCQKRVALDGTACCSTCVNDYNAGLKNNTPTKQAQTGQNVDPTPSPAPVVNRIILTKNKR